MHTSNPRRALILALIGAILGGGFLTAQAQARKSFPDQFQEKWEKAGPNVRVKRHQDGSRTVFQRSRDDTTLVKRTYGANGAVKMVSVYRIGTNGQPLACKIFDGGKNLLYKVSYGFNKSSGRLEAERMFDARAFRPNKDNPRQEQPVRIMYYNYDAQGRATKPEVYTFNEGMLAEDAFGGGTFPHDNPFKNGR